MTKNHLFTSKFVLNFRMASCHGWIVRPKLDGSDINLDHTLELYVLECLKCVQYRNMPHFTGSTFVLSWHKLGGQKLFFRHIFDPIFRFIGREFLCENFFWTMEIYLLNVWEKFQTESFYNSKWKATVFFFKFDKFLPWPDPQFSYLSARHAMRTNLHKQARKISKTLSLHPRTWENV